MAWNACQTPFLCMRLSPSSSLHPQCNLISLWHGLNFPLGGTFIPRHPSTLRLLMECVACEADKNLSALKWGDKSSLDTHTHYIDIYSLVNKVVYWAHAPLCPYIQLRQISTKNNACINIHAFRQRKCEAETILAVSVPDCIALALFHHGQSCSSQTPKANHPIWE